MTWTVSAAECGRALSWSKRTSLDSKLLLLLLPTSGFRRFNTFWKHTHTRTRTHNTHTNTPHTNNTHNTHTHTHTPHTQTTHTKHTHTNTSHTQTHTTHTQTHTTHTYKHTTHTNNTHKRTRVCARACSLFYNGTVWQLRRLISSRSVNKHNTQNPDTDSSLQCVTCSYWDSP